MGRVLYRPGPFELCDWDLKKSVFSISYLSQDMVVILTNHVDGGAKVTLTAYDNSCTEIWQYSQSVRDFVGGELGGEPYAVVYGNGSELVSLKTGAAQLIFTGGSNLPTFGNDNLFFFGKLDDASEFSINRFSLPAGKPEPVAPARGPWMPHKLRVHREVLYAEFSCGTGCEETAIFSPDFSGAKVLPGKWCGTDSKAVPERIIGGIRGGGVLSLAIIED